jgi:hypothetical protein
MADHVPATDCWIGAWLLAVFKDTCQLVLRFGLSRRRYETQPRQDDDATSFRPCQTKRCVEVPLSEQLIFHASLA